MTTPLCEQQMRPPTLWRIGPWAAVASVALAALMAGCAQQPVSNSATTTTRGEPMTASDEPDARRRARIRLELAASYFEQGQTTVALDEIKLSLAADPTYPMAYVLRGLVYMRLNDSRLAEESFQRALSLNPRDPDALHNYGLFACEQGRYALAIEQFDRALATATYGGQGRTLLAKGVCQVRAGRLDDAEASLARSYELDPGNPITAYNLASLQFRRGELTRSQFTIRRVNNSQFANAETLWLGIRVERRLGNQAVVQQLADQLSRRFPDSQEWAAYQRGAFND